MKKKCEARRSAARLGEKMDIFYFVFIGIFFYILYIFILILLAPTGALIVIVCYYWSGGATFSDFEHFCLSVCLGFLSSERTSGVSPVIFLM